MSSGLSLAFMVIGLLAVVFALVVVWRRTPNATRTPLAQTADRSQLDSASTEAKNIRDSLSRMLSDDLFAEFLAQLENEIGVNINQAALRQVITGARGDIDDN